MRTIWKFELDITDVQRVSLPVGAELLHVGSQRMEVQEPMRVGVWDALVMWASVDPARPKVDRLIGVVGTGNPAPEPDEAIYVGSAQCGPFVWHVYDGGEADG